MKDGLVIERITPAQDAAVAAKRQPENLISERVLSHPVKTA